MSMACLWWLIVAFAFACQVSVSPSSNATATSTKSESRRVRRSSNNCKPGRRARSYYVDTARLWERDLTELRLFLDDTLSDLGRQMELLRSQVADVGNDVSRLTSEGCDSSRSPIHLRLERLENNLASLLIRMEERGTTSAPMPEARPLVKHLKTDVKWTDAGSSKEKSFATLAPAPTPETKYTTPEITTSTAKQKYQGKQISTPIPCFWYESPASKSLPSAFKRQTADPEETGVLDVCSRLDPGNPPEIPLKDCSDVPLPRRDGVYWIQPKGVQKPIRVFCDSDGWTVFQRRGTSSSPSENFKRSWAAYAQGFGDLCRDFWLGNTHLYRLTNAYNATLKVQLYDAKGSPTAASTYKLFHVGHERHGFLLKVGEFSGDAKDGLGFQSEMTFATKDRAWSPLALACAELEGSGWWFSETAYSQFIQCNHHLLGSNLNAPYSPFTTLQEELIKLCPANNGTKHYQHIKFANAIYWRGKYISSHKGFTAIEMKMRPSA